MDEGQQKQISKNLVELIKATTCSARFLASFISTSILCQDDVEILELPNLTPTEKSKKLYELLVTRVGSFDVLLQSLKETNQTGALKILKEHTPIYRNYGKITYDKNHVLGKGCSGTKVFKGSFGGRDVAVKVINADVIDPQIAVREIDFLRKLDDNENIVRYFTVESQENYIYIALELCVISLQDEIKLKLLNINPYTIIKKCTNGLAHLHKYNVIHRDLKPANVLLSNNNQVKISDFGLSKQIPVGMTSVSVYSGVVGTADWMAPEVLEHSSDGLGKNQSIKMSTSADIFSLGCIFYFVLTNGHHPFGDGVARQYNILIYKTEINETDIEAEWLQVIKRMLSVPKSRPSADEIYTLYFTHTSIQNNDDSLSQSQGLSKTSTDTPTATLVDFTEETTCTQAISKSDYVTIDIPIPTQQSQASYSKLLEKEQETSNIYDEQTLQIPGPSRESTPSPSVSRKQRGMFSSIADTFRKLSADLDHKLKEKSSPPTGAMSNGTQNPQLTMTDKDGNNALFQAIINGRSMNKIRYLVGQGYDWMARNKTGSSIVHIAVQSGNLEALEYFLSLGADVNARDNFGETPFHLLSVVDKNFTDILTTLVWYHGNINAVNKNGNNLLFLAAFRGRSESELDQILNIGAEWQGVNYKNQSILHLASAGGNAVAIDYFVSMGVDVTGSDSRGENPIHKVRFAEHNFKECIGALFANGASLNAVDMFGNTLLGYLKQSRRYSKERVEFVKSLGGV